ncbi:MAG: type III polyketide synthase [Aestuariivirga sp.]|jgi:alkylresorcinol/alkylpyrone synthase|uniref:type III polyketide synthase n=1 Tax=Aestuariivirga sp. TaxID=2650926 RepID=UPI0038D1ED3D
MAGLLSLVTAVPPYEMRTEDVIREAGEIFGGRHQDFERLTPVFGNSGIARRFSVSPFAWFHQQQGWPERSAAFLEGASALFAEVSAGALDQAGLKPSQIDAIVMVSSTGIATPSVEAHMLSSLGFRPDVQRVPVFGLGCAGGASGLSLAARLARAAPGANVLLVVIELCTLAFRPDEMSKSNIIATALFGDGAAAAVLSTAGHPLGRIEHAGEHTWPGTTDVMGWRMDPEGFGAIFSRSIPDLATSDLRPAADQFLARHGLSLENIQSFCFHPGGAKVVLALEQAFGLAPGRLRNERVVLSEFGNMSAPTVLFVLARELASPTAGRRFLSALGPGFTASFVTMLH